MTGTQGEPVDAEERKIRIEEEKLALESSFARKWGSFVIGACVTLGVAILTIGVSWYQSSIARDDRMSAERQAQLHAEESRKQQEGQWGISVLELYITHPDGFDPVKSPDTARNNMTALALSAPELMKPILQRRLDALVRSGGAQNPEALGAVKTALDNVDQPANSNPTAPTASGPAGVNPADYTMYIQFGGASNDFAARFGEQLQARGFRVPDLEQVGQSTKVPEVRYYRAEQAALAEWLVAQLNDASTQGDASVAKFFGAGKPLPGGIVEIWIPADWR